MIEIYGPEPAGISHQNILDFLRIRKKAFVEDLGWNLTHNDTFEWDQYDLPTAKFIVAYSQGECVGGARLLRCDNQTPTVEGAPVAFMIADFLSGRIPTALTHSALHTPLTPSQQKWEMTRLTAKNRKVMSAILHRVNDYLSKTSATEVLTISPTPMPRLLGALGYKAKPLSQPVNFDGKEYVVLATEVNRSEEARSTSSAA